MLPMAMVVYAKATARYFLAAVLTSVYTVRYF
jgi:hypothetical protein